ncbi:MAG: peptidyl-dipeptidase Dcp [Xanthomonadales bacterium]|nr:peptidyl-dipeptidase Dcp [Xanthomonadales bacterium]MCC6596793.1 peptidyl-dipeptidase Dcp [Rhodanobacteraceae bacterium]MDL1869394.1 peptidyl-dipeptidase Dcp [Gammaproteobacteria bacterium PRO6]
MLRARMMTMTLSLAIAGTLGLAPALHAKGGDLPADNPFAAASTLPFQAPPFDRIKDADYLPAFEAGMRAQLDEIAAIANDKAAPTFDNTLVAMEKSGRLLARVAGAFGVVSSANTNDTLQKVQEDIAPRLAAHSDAIHFNAKLFARIKAVYDQRATLKLDPESLRLLEVTYREFVHAGAQLSAADQARLKQLNGEESSLSAQYVNKLLAAANKAALVVADKARLAGLADAEVAAAAEAAKARKLDGKWVITLQNTTQQPDLQALTDRATRERLFRASWARAEQGDANDTRATIARIAQIRAEKAKLLGFANFAAWQLEDQMARTPATALKFMRDIVPAATAKARAEAADIQALIDKSGTHFALEPWDWLLYSEQVRKARYDLDESQLKPYFELDSVLKNGVFHAAHELYGLSFVERKDIPVYDPDVRVFTVLDHDGSELALFYCDYFKRDNKNGGAWMDNLVGQSRLLGTKPVIYNVGNFTKPAPGQPALLTLDDVNTMFHEFGHALHGIFADAKYPSLSGTNTARDFVEFPSQFNEYWMTEPSVFAHYARHYQTGAPMPQELVERMRRAKTFNKGYDMTELLSAALLDMSWHMLGADAPRQDVDKFEVAALKDNGTDLRYVPPRYRSSYFLHIWGNGYSAGYYAYLWTQMLSDDAWGWFKEHGGLTRANGDRFRAMILSRGNSEDLAKLYRDWRGRDPNVEGMLEQRGLKAAAPAK